MLGGERGRGFRSGEVGVNVLFLEGGMGKGFEIGGGELLRWSIEGDGVRVMVKEVCGYREEEERGGWEGKR